MKWQAIVLSVICMVFLSAPVASALSCETGIGGGGGGGGNTCWIFCGNDGNNSGNGGGDDVSGAARSHGEGNQQRRTA